MALSDQQIFGSSWLANARLVSAVDCWAHQVIADYDTTGLTYLHTVGRWFDAYPAANADKKKLRGELENLSINSGHVAGVNELAWWELMQKHAMSARVVPTAKNSARPDFELLTPFGCFIEVTTLNVSSADEEALTKAPALIADAKSRPDEEENEEVEASASEPTGAALDHQKSIQRIVNKSAFEKLKQLKHAANQQKPAVLVVFDYTAFSAYATDFSRRLCDSLLGIKSGFSCYPTELSALVYVERKVIDGRIALSLSRSAVYYNPFAKFPLSAGSFPYFRQFWGDLECSKPASVDGWINL